MVCRRTELGRFGGVRVSSSRLVGNRSAEVYTDLYEYYRTVAVIFGNSRSLFVLSIQIEAHYSLQEWIDLHHYVHPGHSLLYSLLKRDPAYLRTPRLGLAELQWPTPAFSEDLF